MRRIYGKIKNFGKFRMIQKQAVFVLYFKYIFFYQLWIITDQNYVIARRRLFLIQRSACHAGIKYLISHNIHMLEKPKFKTCKCGACKMFLQKSEILEMFEK